MPKFTYGKTKIIDTFQRRLDAIEATWPMTGSYTRLDPYIVPYLQGGDYYELLIFHNESKSWFDNTNVDYIATSMVKKKMIAEGDVVFDLGSNVGAITIVMARLAGETGHVHAFDPYPWNSAATQCNAELNYFRNVTAHTVGVSNKNCKIMVRPNDSRIYEESKAEGAQELTIHSIDQYMHLKPKFLKIDIEGAEYDVFEGQDPSVFSSVRQFALEFHPFWIRPRGLDPKDALRNMEKAGFSLHYHDVSYPPYTVNDYVDNHHMFWGVRKAA